MDVESSSSPSPSSSVITRKKWVKIFIYAFLLLSCQTAGTILGRLYYDNGGKSKWMGTLIALVGFPVLIPFRFFITLRQKKPETTEISSRKTSSFTIVGPVYFGIGVLLSAVTYLSSYGLANLPASTYSLISASQLIFTAFFSYFLNSQKFTFLIVNSLVLLVISSILLVFNHESEATEVSKANYAIGFVCTVAASASAGLLLSLVQMILRKVLKKHTFSVVLDMVVYQSLIATFAVSIGLFVSGEWRSLGDEMRSYKTGEVSYVMTLAWTALIWQVCTIGIVGLIFESSSVFSNAVSTVGLPLVPILAVVVFRDSMDGLKIISIVLASWGFVSFTYQHYLDDKSLKASSNGGLALVPSVLADKDDGDAQNKIREV